MNLYKEVPDSGQVYYILANDDTSCVTNFTTAFPDESMNPPTLLSGDFTLLDPANFVAHFYLRCASGRKFFVSGAEYKTALARLHIAFPTEQEVAGVELTGNWQLYTNPTTTIPNDPTNRNFFGACTHFGQNNNGDYTADRVPLAIDVALHLGHSGQKTSISMSGAGVPSNKNGLDMWLSAMDATTMQKWGIISVRNRRQSTTSVTVSNPIPEPANGTTYTNAELLAAYDVGYNKGYGFMFTQGYAGRFNYMEAGNEVDVQYIKAATGTAFNTSNYDTEAYKMHFAEMFGLAQGMKAGDPNVKVGINGGFIHWGHAVQMGIDSNSTPAYLSSRGITAGSNKKWDFYSEHWYNDMEYARSLAGVPYAGTAMSMTRTKLAPYYPSIGIGEAGLNIEKTNPNKLTTAQYNRLSIDQYWHGTTGPKADHYIIYEMFNSVITRANSLGERSFGLTNGDLAVGQYSATVVELANKLPFPQ